MEDLERLEGPLRSIEKSICCIANEIILYDTWDTPKHVQVSCARHLLQIDKRAPESLKLVSMSNNTKLTNEGLVQAMNLSKQVRPELNLAAILF